MAASKAQEVLRQRKEARQKKMLFVLVPIFLLLIVWQGPKTYKALMGGSAPPPTAAPASTEPASTTPDATAPEPSSAPAPSTEAPGPTDTTAAPSSGLPDTDPAPPASTGQLLSFSVFTGKDPFLKSGILPGTTGSDSSSSTTGQSQPQTGSTTTNTSSGDQTPPGSETPSGSEMPATAHVSVNGSSQTVSAGVSFPKSHPLFRIAAIGKTYVKIGLVKGHFLDGKATEKLIVGKSITLVSQPDGTPYTIALVSIG